MKVKVLITGIILIVSNTILVFIIYNQNKQLEYLYKHSDFLKRKESKLVFDTYSYDFGKVKLNKNYSLNFSFTNTGKKQIRLLNVLPTCGCTAVNWSKEPILPGAKGDINLNYHAGPVGEFTKKIGVVVEGENKPIELEIKGNVVAR